MPYQGKTLPAGPCPGRPRQAPESKNPILSRAMGFFPSLHGLPLRQRSLTSLRRGERRCFLGNAVSLGIVSSHSRKGMSRRPFPFVPSLPHLSFVAGNRHSVPTGIGLKVGGIETRPERAKPGQHLSPRGAPEIVTPPTAGKPAALPPASHVPLEMHRQAVRDPENRQETAPSFRRTWKGESGMPGFP